MRLFPLVILLSACGDETPTTADSAPAADSSGGDGPTPPGAPPGQCGDVGYFDVSVVGLVVGPDGTAAVGAAVSLEERNWDPQTYASGTTDAYGAFTLVASQIVGVEDCWGVAVDYVVVATQGSASAERDVNQSLFNAVSPGGDGVADISAFPLELELADSGAP
jgi:hypothetical protein